VALPRKHRRRPRLGGKLGRVYRADAGICHLCHLPVPANADPESDQAPTVDHLVTRSEGGSDDKSNLRLAHRRCNNIRQDRPMLEIPPGTFDNIWR
jgi:5-methylcytosine-specific restriction endonuclease McrA